MNIAIILVHNKGDQANFNQIKLLKTLVAKVTDTNEQFDDEGNSIGTFDTYHYEINGLVTPHQLRFYQVFPFGITPPDNKDEVDSYKVYYGKGDEDKTGDHSRFFNWGVKRGTDYGANIVIYLNDYANFSFEGITADLTKLANTSDSTEYIENSSCKAVSVKLFKEIGQLSEDKSMTQALVELKQKIRARGWKNV